MATPRPTTAAQPPDTTPAQDAWHGRLPVSRRTIFRAAIGVAGLSAVGAATWAGWGLLKAPLRPRWIATTGGSVFSSPTAVDGTLYVGSRDHYLYALDVRTGRERWRYRTGAPVTSTPAVAGGRVYIGSNDTKVHAVASTPVGSSGPSRRGPPSTPRLR